MQTHLPTNLAKLAMLLILPLLHNNSLLRRRRSVAMLRCGRRAIASRWLLVAVLLRRAGRLVGDHLRCRGLLIR